MTTPASGPKVINRREFLKLGGVGIAGVSLLGAAGCSKGEREGPAKLIFTHGPDGAQIWQEQIDRFNRRHQGEIKVVLHQAPADTGQYFEMLRTGFQAGETRADVISGDVIWPAQFAAKGWISDLSNRFSPDLQSRHLPGAIASNTSDGGIYGVPWFTDAGMLYYRKDLLEKSGFSEAPRTWDKLMEISQKVQRDQNIKYGYAFQGADYEGGVVNALEFVWNAGGDVLGPKDRVVIGEPRAVDGLRAARGMVESGTSPEAVSSFKELEAYTVFLAGDAVFMRNWPFVYALSSNPSLSKVKPEQIGLAPLPTARSGERSSSGLGGWNLMINAATHKMDAAWAFIEYLSGSEQQKERALKGGYLPTLKALYDDSEILKEVPVAALGKEAIKNVRSRPTSPYYYDMSLAISGRFHASLTGSISPKEEAAALQRDLQKILARAEKL
ncbi:MAG TPA: ABC transporter substrate-binding protein [Rubrobacteraceae bacterium]|nr:ABC transporter substrate-binding protein [Rubrobacteraceae bacterium]